MHIYRLRLEWIVERMLSVEYAKENSVAVVSYMAAVGWGVMGYLRPVNTPSLLEEQRLLNLVHNIMNKQENEFEIILSHINYEIEDQSTLSMLGIDANEHSNSVGRVEGVSRSEAPYSERTNHWLTVHSSCLNNKYTAQEH